MEDGRWKMEDGRWKKEDGRRKKEDGRLKFGDGRWKMANGKTIIFLVPCPSSLVPFFLLLTIPKLPFPSGDYGGSKAVTDNIH
jgi:hypothetical protein